MWNHLRPTTRAGWLCFTLTALWIDYNIVCIVTGRHLVYHSRPRDVFVVGERGPGERLEAGWYWERVDGRGER